MSERIEQLQQQIEAWQAMLEKLGGMNQRSQPMALFRWSDFR